MAENELEKVLEQEITEPQAPAPVRKTTKKKRKRRRRKRPFLFVLFIILILFACYKFVKSDFFTMTTFEVEGNSYYTKAQVAEISGIEPGWNLFSYDLKEIKAKLLEDPYIKLATVTPVPNETMKITIEERREYACIPYGGQYIIIDEDGLVLRISETEPVLTQLEGMTVTDMTPGKPLTTEETYLLADTLDLLKSVEDNDIYFQKIVFSTVVVKAYIRDKLYCEGTPSNIKENMNGISLLAQELYSQDIVYGIIKVGGDNYLSFSPMIE